MHTETLTASQLRTWLIDHGVTDARRRIAATADARTYGHVLIHGGQRYTVRRVVAGERIWYTIDRRPLRSLVS